MIVIAALNGSLTSEATAYYALHYSRIHGFGVHLLHVHNVADDREAVNRSIKALETEARNLGVETERVFLEGRPVTALRGYIDKLPVDTVFCSTRATRRLFQGSFSEKLVRMDLKCDVAVARIVNIETARNHNALLLAIKDARLDVRKFTFFAGLAKAYEAPSEIYSVKVMPRRSLALLGRGSMKKILRKIDNQLAHYKKLSLLTGIDDFRLKHAITTSEDSRIIHHVLAAGHDLILIGGYRLTMVSTLGGERPIERLMRQTPVNLIAYYPGAALK